jgi:hypothetical protein
MPLYYKHYRRNKMKRAIITLLLIATMIISVTATVALAAPVSGAVLSLNMGQSDLGSAATVIGTSIVSMPSGEKARHFNGAGDYVTVANSDSLNPTGGLSVEVFFKLDEVNKLQYLVSKGWSDSTGQGYGLMVRSDNHIVWIVYDAKGVKQGLADNTMYVEAGKWYHVVGTWYKNSANINNSKIHMYINGVHTVEMPCAGINHSSFDLNIGKYAPGKTPTSYNFANGDIATVRVYNKALTSSQVNTNYNEEKWKADSPTPTPTPTPTGIPTPTPGPGGIPTPTPVPTATPVPAPVSTEPQYDLEAIQNFYNDEYLLIHSPHDIITYDGQGGYTITPVNNWSTPAPTPAPANFAISGLVTGAADGKPIGGASVVVDGSLQKTNDNGEYKFGDVKAGSYDVAVSADGYASRTQTIAVADDVALNFALDKAEAGTAPVAGAANETATATPVATQAPLPTQTRSPGFESALAVLAVIAVAGALIYMGRKR